MKKMQRTYLHHSLIVEILVYLLSITLNVRPNEEANWEGWEHVNITLQCFLNLCDSRMGKLSFREIK